MGFGDEIIGTGLARGANMRGKRIAFGNGNKISWGPWCQEIFRNNPNIAPPGAENAYDIEWINHCKGNRLYNRLVNGRWVWNYDFRVRPGEFFFDSDERMYRSAFLPGFVVMEPNVPWQKTVAPNKDWGEYKYRAVSHALHAAGFRIVQFKHNNSRRILEEAKLIDAGEFRRAIAVLSRASLYIGPEGGMHHAAAAVGVKAVVLFGGFIPPSVVGYDEHVCLTGGVTACGNIQPCVHCRDAMNKITVDDVLDATMKLLT